MTTVLYGSSFERVFRKKVGSDENLKKKFLEKIEIFKKDPFDPQLRTHKLGGQLKDLWSFRIDYDVRVLFYFSSKDHVVFVDIGTHDEVY